MLAREAWAEAPVIFYNLCINLLCSGVGFTPKLHNKTQRHAHILWHEGRGRDLILKFLLSEADIVIATRSWVIPILHWDRASE